MNDEYFVFTSGAGRLYGGSHVFCFAVVQTEGYPRFYLMLGRGGWGEGYSPATCNCTTRCHYILHTAPLNASAMPTTRKSHFHCCWLLEKTFELLLLSPTCPFRHSRLIYVLLCLSAFSPLASAPSLATVPASSITMAVSGPLRLSPESCHKKQPHSSKPAPPLHHSSGLLLPHY